MAVSNRARVSGAGLMPSSLSQHFQTFVIDAHGRRPIPTQQVQAHELAVAQLAHRILRTRRSAARMAAG